MPRLGMDVDLVESVAQQLLRRADDLELFGRQVREIVRELVDGPAGESPEFVEFVEEWRICDAKTRLVAKEIEAMGKQTLEDVAQQRRVSAERRQAPSAGLLAYSAAGLTGPGAVAVPALVSVEVCRGLVAAVTGRGTPPGTYAECSVEELRDMGLERGDLADRGCGFDASVFSGPGGIRVVVFRALPAGGRAADRQVELAVRLAKRLEEADPSARVLLTGARSGGRLAVLGALATGFAAVTLDGSVVDSGDLAHLARVREGVPEESADSTVDGLRTELTRLRASGRLVEVKEGSPAGAD